MENQDEKRGRGRPSFWPPELGPTINNGYRSPEKVHKVLNTWQIRLFLSCIILYPWFRDKVFSLLGELIAQEETSLRKQFPDFDTKIKSLLKKKP